MAARACYRVTDNHLTPFGIIEYKGAEVVIHETEDLVSIHTWMEEDDGFVLGSGRDVQLTYAQARKIALYLFQALGRPVADVFMSE